MATYIAVVSLMQDLEHIVTSNKLLFMPERALGEQFYGDIFRSEQFFWPSTKEEIEILYQTVVLMDSLLGDSSGQNPVLEEKLRDVTHKARNFLDLWAVLCLPDPEILFGCFTGNNRSSEITEERSGLGGVSSTGNLFPHPGVCVSRRPPNAKVKPVGLEEDLQTMLYCLTGGPLKLKVFSIVGMAGIGKTTFARRLYQNLVAMHHFYVCAWVTISRQYQLREILKGILHCVTNVPDEIYGKGNEDLREQVFTILKGRTYLIVLDGLCDTKAWDALMRAFPDDENGSRIIMTSRFRDVAVHASNDSPPHNLRCLNREESWKLLHSIISIGRSEIFVDHSFPLEFLETGKRIAHKCQGLPLAIVVVGWLVRNLGWVKYLWDEVERNIGSLGMNKAKCCQEILTLSYNHLPNHLKTCFLYTGIFPAIYQISVEKLKWLWIANGFVKRTTNGLFKRRVKRNLEKVAEHYFSDLTASSLIMVRSENCDGRMKTCCMYDLIRELCLRESLKENFRHVMRNGGSRHLRDICDRRKVSLTGITQEIVSINEELKKIHDERKVPDLEITSYTGKSVTLLSPSRRTSNMKGKLMGVETDLVMMLDCLTGHQSKLRVLSIIGMAGIGKTTFSQKLYENQFVMHHFDIRVWVTVSQQYQIREILIGILLSVTNVSDEIYGKSNEGLREQVYKSLRGKRYLIVLDDMWDTKAWDDLKRTFPDDKNGSRIMLTSRLRNVAGHASEDTPPHCLRCLTVDESWELLSSKIFVDESCPPEFVAIGKQIAHKCRGLPLALVVVGGLLSKRETRLDVWEEVAQSVGSLVMEEAENCQNILALSYNHLPDHLKACFLYMGMFPEDYEISVTKLIWLWVAEGFIRTRLLKSVEEVAEDYLEDLRARSLILVKKKRSDGRMKTCYIHDLMRELCLRESRKQNFLHVINGSRQLQLRWDLQDNRLLQFDTKQHQLRLSFHSSIQNYIQKPSLPYARSVLCFGKISLSDPQGYLGLHFKLLRVLDIMDIHLMKIPTEILCLTRLKLLAISIQNYFDMMYFVTLCSLQTLIVDCEWDGHLCWILWDMPELRHFHLKRISLPYSKCSTSVAGLLGAKVPLMALNNLQSLSTIRPASCTKTVFLSMPNLKKLGIHEFEEDCWCRGWFKNLFHLRELEKLKYVFSNPFANSASKPDRLPSWDIFPPKLVKLTLSGTSLPWEDMLKLSMLPKLEVLKLRNYAFSGAVWKSGEGGFRRLKFLLIGSTDLQTWEADGDHFPNLQHLVLRHCRSLKEIPYGIGEAPLLENIELHCCNDSAVKSAKELQKEQQSLGNDMLTIRITGG